MSLKLGANNIILPYQKAYLGADLIYSKEAVLTQGDIIPKTWIEDTAGILYHNGNIILSTSNTSYSSEFYPCYACDGDVNTQWDGRYANNYYLTIDFGTKQKITKMKTWVSCGSATRFSYCIVQGSNDNSEWTDLYTISSVQSSLTEIELNNPDYYRYYRLHAYITNTSYAFRLNEWQVSEYYK